MKMAAVRWSSRILYSVVVVIAFCVCFCSGQEDVLKYTVIEESHVGYFVGDIREDSKLRSTASEEEFSQISYSILSTGEPYEAYFSMDSVNGSLYTAVKIDRETLSACAFEITCNLSLSIVARAVISSFYRTLKVQITIQDINDHPPTFPKDLMSLDISELATVGSEMSLVGAIDADSGPYSLQRYYIVNEDRLMLPFTTSFETFVDGSSVVKLQITGELDREVRDTYTLIIAAEDGGNPKLTGTMTVFINIEDTNDNAPVFTQTEYEATINETIAKGTEILRLSANDADLGVNSDIEYRLSTHQIGKIQEQFSLNESTGVLAVKERFSSGGQYRIIVEASDKGTQPLMTQAVVVVTVLDSDNNSPEITINLFSESNMGAVSEYADIGTVVAHVMITDTDTGVNGIITCDIESDNQVFKLQGYDQNQFKVIVAKGIDREQLAYIFVVINCYDKGSPPKTSFVEFTIQVIDENDHAPLFLQEIYFVDVLENNQLDIDIVQVSAIDSDVGKNADVTYSVWATGMYRFSMDPLSGIIKTQSVFDRETDNTIVLYAYAKDNGSPSNTSTATVQINVIDMNDNDPRFVDPLYLFYVPENAAANTNVGYVQVLDDDSGDNALLGLQVDADLPFTIDSAGVIRTNEALDRETANLFSFLVTAYDHGVPSRNTTANVVVHVTDVNDNAPTFVFPDADNYTIELDAETLSSAVIEKIKAFDIDEGKNSELSYAIVNKNVTKLFAIDSMTGDLTLRRPVVETDSMIYHIKLRVEDDGNPKLFTTTALNVFIAKKAAAPVTDNNGENLLIAITLSSVTFVLVFTAVLVICILKRRWLSGHKDDSQSDDMYCEKGDSGGSDRRRVKFADFDQIAKSSSPARDSMDAGHEPMTTFSSDGNDSRDSEMTSSTVDMETPILEKQKHSSIDKVVQTMRKENLPGISETHEMHHSSPRSDTTQPRYDIQTPRSDTTQPRYDIQTPRSDTTQPRYDVPPPRYEQLQQHSQSDHQLQTLQSHSSLLNAAIKPQASMTSTFSHDDNHSQTSGETVTSDSGRGGSESDLNSASLSQSHDAEIRPLSKVRYTNEPIHSTFVEPPKPWLNLADLKYHNCNKLPVAQQLHDDRKHRLQLRNLADRKSARPTTSQNTRPHSGFQTQSDRNLDRFRTPAPSQQHQPPVHPTSFASLPKFTAPVRHSTIFPHPPSDIDRSFVTYDDDDDDLSTTTSGSYVIDQEDTSLDLRSPIPKAPGLRSCLV